MSEVRTEIDDTADAQRARSSPALAVWRIARFAVWTTYCHFAHLRARFATRDPAERRRRAALWTHRWLRGVVRLSGIDVRVEGEPPASAVLLAPNHISYLDIMVVGAATPTMFVSRADVQHWPIFGHIFKSSEHIGIARADRRGVAKVNEMIGERFDAGVPVCVFLEGTSGSGQEVMPFHASLVQPAIERGVPIMPVALRWEATAPGTCVIEDVAYWRQEHVIGPHLWRVLGLKGIRAKVAFGAPIPPGEVDRKALAAQTREHVVALLGAAQAGE